MLCKIVESSNFVGASTSMQLKIIAMKNKSRKSDQRTLFVFMEGVIADLRELGRLRTSETYSATLKSFRRFRRNRDVALRRVDSQLVMSYEAYLRSNGLSPNSSSFYLRILRAVYNRAVDQDLAPQSNPFKHVYTGVEKTVKRAISLDVLRRLKSLNLSQRPRLEFARDMFLFSFYTRGMSFIDMAYLRRRDLVGGVLKYRRRKTGQQLLIKWEPCMQAIVDKHSSPLSPFLLPIVDAVSTEAEQRMQYIYAAHNINRGLKQIGIMLGLSMPLTMYVARHAWASIARSCNVPLSVISEGMGHDSESTTRIYLASLDNVAIDRANSQILRML